MIRRTTLFVLGAAALAAASLPAAARDRVAVGTLECRSPGTVSFIVSVSDYACVFRSVSGRDFRYYGQIRRVGLDVGITGREVLVWRVWAPTSQIDRRALRGGYGGAHAGAGVVVGLGANALVGGSNNTISLQPLSVEATTGVNFALSVSSLTLD